MYASNHENHPGDVTQISLQRETPVIAGRDTELELIDEILNGTLAGHGGLLLISGEAGIGKTTLVQYLMASALDQRAVVLIGGCYALSPTPAFGPWAEIARLFPERSDLPDLPEALVNADEFRRLGSRELFFERAKNFLLDVANRRPLVLIIEDAQLADPDSVDLLRFVVRRLEQSSMLVVVTYNNEITRMNYLYQALPFLIREGHAIRLELRQLDASGMRALIQQRYRLNTGDETRLIELLQEYTRGNPFFVGELLRALEHHQILSGANDEWRLADQPTIPVPPLVRQGIELRAAELDELAVKILEIAAVIGPEIPLDLLRTVSSATHEELVHAIESVVQVRLLEEMPGDSGLQFPHGLIREAIYQSIVNIRRREIHRQIGQELLNESETRADSIAFHLDRAGDPRAAGWLIKAGLNAQQTYAWRYAAERLESALKYLEESGNSLEQRCWLMLQIGHLLRYGNPQRSVELLERARELAAKSDDLSLKAVTQFSLGNFQLFVRDYERGIPNMEEALDIPAGSPEDPRQAGTILQLEPPYGNFELGQLPFNHDQGDNFGYQEGLLAVGYATIGRFRDTLQISARYIADAEETVSSDGYQSNLSNMQFQLARAWTYAAYGMIPEAELAFEEAAQGFASIGHHFMIYWIAVHELELLVWPYQTDRFVKRKRLADMADEALDRASGVLPMGLAVEKVLLPYLVFEGRWQEAHELISPLELPPGPAGWHLVFHRAAGTLLRGQNDLPAAWDQIHQALPRGVKTKPGTEPFFHTLSLQRLAVNLAVDDGDIAEAWAWLDAHDRWLETFDAAGDVVLGRAQSSALRALIYLAQGNHRDARTTARQALSQAADPVQPLVLIFANRVLGRAKLAAGDPAGAEVSLRQSLRLAEQCQLPYEAAEAQLNLAQAHANAGDMDSARDALAAVRRTCQHMGATRLLQQAEAVADTWDSPVPDPQPVTGDAGITPRELQVLELVADELTDAEIGGRLYISSRTVSQHLRSVYNKLGVNSRIEAVAAAQARGLLNL